MVYLSIWRIRFISGGVVVFISTATIHSTNRKATNMSDSSSELRERPSRIDRGNLDLLSSVFVERPAHRSSATHNYPGRAREICVWYLFIDHTTYSTSREQTIAVQTLGSPRGTAHRCTLSSLLGDMKFRNLRVIGTTSAFDIGEIHGG